MSDFVGDLSRLHRYAMGLQQLMDELQRASPEHSEGTDRSGMVRAVYSRDGLPETIRVSPYWQEKLRPAAFGAAVTEACQAAATRRGAAWAQALERAGWQERLDRLREDSARAATDPGPVPAAFRRPGSGEPSRPAAALAEDAIRLSDTAAALRAGPQPEPAPSATTTNRGRTLAIMLTRGGQLTCQADPRWVSERSGVQLSEELRALLAPARLTLAPQTTDDTGARTAIKAEADRLFADSLAVLDQIGRHQNPSRSGT
jgi:hypothetical protein